MEDKEFAEKAEKLIALAAIGSTEEEPTELLKLAREIVRFGHVTY